MARAPRGARSFAAALTSAVEAVGAGRVARITGIPRVQVERIVRAYAERRPLGGVIRSEASLNRYRAGLAHLATETKTGQRLVGVPEVRSALVRAGIPVPEYRPPEKPVAGLAPPEIEPDVARVIFEAKDFQAVLEVAPEATLRPHRYKYRDEAYRYARDIVRSGARDGRVYVVQDPDTGDWMVAVDEQTPSLRRR